MSEWEAYMGKGFLRVFSFFVVNKLVRIWICTNAQIMRIITMIAWTFSSFLNYIKREEFLLKFFTEGNSCWQNNWCASESRKRKKAKFIPFQRHQIKKWLILYYPVSYRKEKKQKVDILNRFFKRSSTHIQNQSFLE